MLLPQSMNRYLTASLFLLIAFCTSNLNAQSRSKKKAKAEKYFTVQAV